MPKTETTFDGSECKTQEEFNEKLSKHILSSCTNAYVGEDGKVYDPCHFYFTETGDPTKW